MTKEALSRGEEIQDEINHLKRAIIDINEKPLFDDKKRPNICCIQDVNPFLSMLHADIKTFAVKQIKDKIDYLEREFNAL